MKYQDLSFCYGMKRQRICLAEPLAGLYCEFGLKTAVRQK